MKLTIEELIENVKDELLCYEGMEKATAKWEGEFRQWVEENKKKSKDLIEEKDGIYFKIKDEEEIFEMADAYIDAVEDGDFRQYWEKF